jgi:hypothetical protein
VRAAVHRRKASRVNSTDLPAKPKHANGGQDAGGPKREMSVTS